MNAGDVIGTLSNGAAPLLIGPYTVPLPYLTFAICKPNAVYVN